MERRVHGNTKFNLIKDRMVRNLFLFFLVLSLAFASPVPQDSESVESSGESSEEQPRNLEDRGLIEDLLINLIRDMNTNQINSILGITTTTPCGGLLGGGLLCP